MTALHFWSSSFFVIGDLIYPLRGLLEVIEYRVWLRKVFKTIKIYRHKELLLDEILRKCNSAKRITYFEFGVAFGEMTSYLISRTTIPFQYYGFDTFEGLPKAWRKLPAGAISTKGQIPKMVGENISFHKGLIKETIDEVDFSSDHMKCFIFDFDLYEPTLFAFKHVIPEIKIGDIVYFDEAFDSDERIIIDNYFLELFEYSVLGATPFAIAFVITGVKTSK
jgi:hypothetical protein